ncbi:Na+/H+ antiporter [Cohnella abietis]|uniref:Sodium, potassium, lithium and rubidium/H(+) antiporter n=1 Tax=Cohnella abietis TaxID=2507935 RepID=A0A3T1D3V6_9BACL|nr:Na+/H+ antiporter [Cohnella abietis]BBI32718.1 sodium, potassium, lithium and rubidium/H(+) antiporter [Cohnella abietis]
MELFLFVLLMLGLIGVSNVINRFVPFIPVPLIQIALGVALALIPSVEHVELNPELFLVLFIAPLLFNDGRRTPRNELWKLRAPILLMALGLVLATIIVVGPFIHWLIPDIPLAAAFALAAILSPTDAVAVGSIAGRIRLPHNIMRLLEGEALMNDASGLVAFKFAIAAAVTGVFSVGEATLSFILIAVGGLLAGAILALLLIRMRVSLQRLGMEDVTIHMLILIMTPFLIYMISEEIGVSGILAVVAGGIVHAIERDRVQSASAELRIVSENTWTVILFILNGLVFIILGLEVPDVVSVIVQDQAYKNGMVFGYILLITAALLALRFIWVYLLSSVRKPGKLHESILTALSGVRGAITLAGAFSIPLVISNGTPFPQRDLIIFLSAGVILLTLVLASALLPLIYKSPKVEAGIGEEISENIMQIRLLKAGLKTVRDNMTDENRGAALSIISDYQQQLQWISRKDQGCLADMQRKTVEIRLQALQSEGQTVRRWLEEGRITEEVAQASQFALKQTEVILTHRFKFLAASILWTIRHFFHKKKHKEINKWTKSELKPYKELKIQSINDAVETIKRNIDDTNRGSSLMVMAHYQDFKEMIQAESYNPTMDEELQDQKKELQVKAFQSERNVIQVLYERGDIDRSMTSKLRLFLNYREANVFESELVET